MNSDKSIDLLADIEKLMRLNGDNPFKIRAFEKAQQSIAGRTDLLERAQAGTLTEIEGIGKGISEVLTEFLVHGTSKIRDELTAQLPQGLLELTEIPGLGPKKARTIIDELGIQSVGELEYACRENRLVGLKGFGEKAQAQILQHIEGMKARRNKALLPDAETMALMLLQHLRSQVADHRIEITGQVRRQLEIVDSLDFLIEGQESLRSKFEAALVKYSKDSPVEIPIRFHFADEKSYARRWIETTAAAAWLKEMGKLPEKASEKEIFQSLKIEWVEPNAWETDEAARLMKSKSTKTDFVSVDQIQGVFHNHTTRSDGRATLDQMISKAVELGYKYIGISDHSQSAFYAQGLKPEDLKAQRKEIDDIREKYPEIKIFWGVESDILQDGSLDYSDAVLKNFDFVIGSIHSRFKMDKDGMTKRILKAIENPRTTMIGHLTGRLLLGREGYDLDFEKVISTAAKHRVVIETNANPQRLDLDWRHGGLMREYGTMTCINPDAHDTAGLEDVRYGVAMVRKAMLPPKQVLNTRSAKEVEAWLKDRRS